MYHKQLFIYANPSIKGNDGGFPEEKDSAAIHEILYLLHNFKSFHLLFLYTTLYVISNTLCCKRILFKTILGVYIF